MIPATRQTMRADRVIGDIGKALADADALELRLAAGETIYSQAGQPGTPEEIREAAKSLGLDQIKFCMSPEWQTPETIQISTMEGLGFSDIALSVAKGIYAMDMQAR